MSAPEQSPPPGVEESPSAPAAGTTQPSEAVNLLTLGAEPATLQEAQEKGTTDEAQEVQRLATELAEAQRAMAASQSDEMVMVRVEEPHSELHYGGVRLTNDFSAVPRRMLGALTTAANDSHATITTQES